MTVKQPVLQRHESVKQPVMWRHESVMQHCWGMTATSATAKTWICLTNNITSSGKIFLVSNDQVDALYRNTWWRNCMVNNAFVGPLDHCIADLMYVSTIGRCWLCQPFRPEWLPSSTAQWGSHGQEVPVPGFLWGRGGDRDPATDANHPEGCLQCEWQIWGSQLTVYRQWNGLSFFGGCLLSLVFQHTHTHTHTHTRMLVGKNGNCQNLSVSRWLSYP